MARTLRLLAELVEGPAVRTARGTLEFLAGKPFEQGVTNTIPRRAVAVVSDWLHVVLQKPRDIQVMPALGPNRPG